MLGFVMVSISSSERPSFSFMVKMLLLPILSRAENDISGEFQKLNIRVFPGSALTDCVEGKSVRAGSAVSYFPIP